MAERLWVLGFVAVFSAWHWQRLERPQLAAAELMVLTLLAVAPAILAGLGRRRLAIAAAVVALPAAIWRGFGYLPWDRGHTFYPLRIGEGLRDGAKSWFDTVTPFDAGRFATTGGLVELSFFLLIAAFAWLLLDGRYALAALGTAFALFAIPSTAVGMGDRGLRAAMFLLLALAILAVCQRRVPLGGSALGQLSALAAATVVAGLVVGSAPGVAKGAFFDWRHWNPLAGNGARVSVGYVWSQQYGPLRFPKTPTTVFTVASTRPHYWKAGVLTDFEGDRWVEQSHTQDPFHDSDAIAAPASLLPPKAVKPDKRSDIIEVGFKIAGLADPHLLGTGQALSYDLTTRISGILTTDDTGILNSDPPQGTTYTVRSYSPDPAPKDLAGAGTRFPSQIADGVNVNGQQIPIWGSGAAPVTTGVVDPALLAASNKVWHDSGADDPSTGEYGAAAAVESYFHSKSFHYDQTPPFGSGPVLADFMLHSHRGYCQMFSGSMALVLRLHGIPARIAVGFTEGTQTSIGHYAVLDRDAHAWVEVYFPGYGWIPFEPTPTRRLPVQTSTTNANWLRIISNRQEGATIGLPSLLRKRLLPTTPSNPTQGNPDAHKGSGRGNSSTVLARRSGGHSSFFVWAVSATAVLLAALAAVKLVAVRWRYLRRGPRGQASAAYHELSTYLGDQGVAVPANATFEELARIVDATWGVDASELAAAGSAARYAPPATALAAGRRVRPALRRIRREMRASLSLRDRAMGALRLRSMLAQTTHLE